jgi:hypothetical protein
MEALTVALALYLMPMAHGTHQQPFLGQCGPTVSRSLAWIPVPPLSQPKISHKPLFLLVGAAGFEPATFCSQSRRATKLRYAPPEVIAGNNRPAWYTLQSSPASKAQFGLNNGKAT